MRETLGVVIGRFQVDDLTPGHRFLMDSVTRQYHRVLVLLGTCAVELKNPLSFEVRRDMFYRSFPRALVQPVYDIPQSDKVWSDQVDRIVDQFYPDSIVTLVGGRDCFLPRYSGRFQKRLIDSIDCPSGTETRASIAEEIRPTKDFRAGIIFGISQLLRPRTTGWEDGKIG